MARYQIQGRRLGADAWVDLPTDAYSRRNYNTAIAGARLAEAEGQAFGRTVSVRVVRVRWTATQKVVWDSSAP